MADTERHCLEGAQELNGRCQATQIGNWRCCDFTFTFHFHALEKETATHSSVVAWRIPGTGEPGRLPSMGSQRVGHDWATELNWTERLCPAPFSPVSLSTLYRLSLVRFSGIHTHILFFYSLDLFNWRSHIFFLYPIFSFTSISSFLSIVILNSWRSFISPLPKVFT